MRKNDSEQIIELGRETLGNKRITPMAIHKFQNLKSTNNHYLIVEVCSFVLHAYTKRHQVPTQKCANKEKYIWHLQERGVLKK
jgi:hypothetical protein